MFSNRSQVCVAGFTIICVALIVFVQAKNVYPQLLLARLFFSIGGAAASTMVTAVLPTISYVDVVPKETIQRPTAESRHAPSPSTASELTITPARFHSQITSRQSDSSLNSKSGATDHSESASKIAGFVGTFTGFGALLALFVFLPLPAAFQHKGFSPDRALKHSYYIVALVALILAAVCFFGLRNLRSDEKKGLRYLLKGTSSNDEAGIRTAAIETARNLYRALLAGFERSDIGIGYIGGFVARASSVGISLFIPLLVNALFTSSGLCNPPPEAGDPTGLPDIKRRCPRAYLLAAALTGVAETVALVTAPLFGYWSAKTKRKSLPLAVAAISGIIGYPLFAMRFDPDDNNKADRAVAFIAACLIGFSQIGAIVCSLGSLSTGILSESQGTPISAQVGNSNIESRTTLDGGSSETFPLLKNEAHLASLSDLKGSVAGVYSFYGGAAILILTKAGGALFDKASKGSPFYIMAAFNGILLLASITVGVKQYRNSR